MENAPKDIQPTWDDLRVLLALHRQGSFLAAGRALGISTSTTARRVDAIETALGRTLVTRTRSGARVLPEALPLVTLAEQLELGLDALRRGADDDALSGTVRISLSEGFVRGAVQCVAELRRKHPRLTVELVSETKLADVGRREADVAIRTGGKSSPSLVQKTVGKLRCRLYAAPSYVERRLPGGHLRVSELGLHDVIGWEGPLAKLPPMNWLEAHGARRFVVRSNTYQGVLEAAVLGQGITMLAPGAGPISELVALDVDAKLPEVPIQLVFHPDMRRVPRVRLVIDALTAMLRGALRGMS